MNDMQEVQEQLYLNKGVILLLLIILSGSCLISVRSSLQQLQTAIIKCSCPAWAHTGGLKTLRVRWRPEMDHFEVHWLVVIFLLSTNTVNLYFMEVRCNHSLGLHFYSKLQQFRAHTHTHTHVHAVVEEHWHVQVTLSTHEAGCSVAVLRVHCVM